jgi:hypothetical protein
MLRVTSPNNLTNPDTCRTDGFGALTPGTTLKTFNCRTGNPYCRFVMLYGFDSTRKRLKTKESFYRQEAYGLNSHCIRFGADALNGHLLYDPSSW